jgi:hypothetical protein
MHRYARQTKLAGVGEPGQLRITNARVDVPLDGLAGEVAARYLAGAGVGRLCVRDSRIAAAARAVDPAVSVEVTASSSPAASRAFRAGGDAVGASPLRDPSAQAVERGARFALDALRAVIEGGVAS